MNYLHWLSLLLSRSWELIKTKPDKIGSQITLNLLFFRLFFDQMTGLSGISRNSLYGKLPQLDFFLIIRKHDTTLYFFEETKMKSTRLLPFFWILFVFIFVSLACSAGQPTPAPVEPVTTVEAVAVETEAPVAPTEEVAEPTEVPQVQVPSGGISALEDVEKAVVRIVAEGSFVDPEVGWVVDVGGSGTGFIIDPSGIAVTNNHVVTGAALLKVYVMGETRPRNAKILGVSECSDLAVIDIDGEDFPYLDWYEGDIKVGLKVYAAGFPLGDPNYTLTDGIVSKSEADGETNWASVDSVIEHSAKINPGNSGGPLVSESGEVIGVNYAVVSSTDQNFAIHNQDAKKVISVLKEGKDVDSIGVNGGAVYGEVSGIPIYGVWVRSVASGSPADKARIKPGDIIYEIEGKPVAQDGTMADYCDVIRSRQPTATMSLTVIRFNDLSLLEGQLNGRELEVMGYFSGDEGTSTTDTPTGDVLELYDDTGTIYVQVPGDWVDYNGGQWTFDDEVIGVAISAAPSLEDYNSYWDAPGVFFGASDTFARYGGYVQFLDYYSEDYRSGCTFGGRNDYNDGLYKGKYDFYYNCGGAGGYDAYVLSAVDINAPTSSIILVLVQVPKGDEDTVRLIWDSFLVGEL
jgi:serine protease Do